MSAPIFHVDASILETLQDAAAANGNGVAINMKPHNALTVEVTGTFVASVNFEGTIDDTNWFSVGLKTAIDGVAVVSAAAPAVVKLPADGPLLSQFRARISGYVSGSVTVKSRKGRF